MKQLLVLGSKAILASVDDATAARFGDAFQGSLEADVAVLDWKDAAVAASELIEGSIGEGSPFQAAFGYYADGVEPDLATLPEGWRERLVPFDAGDGVTGLCLEPHDLAAAKLAAGRTKDEEFLLDCIAMRVIRRDTLAERVDRLPLPSGRRSELA